MLTWDEVRVFVDRGLFSGQSAVETMHHSERLRSKVRGMVSAGLKGRVLVIAFGTEVSVRRDHQALLCWGIEEAGLADGHGLCWKGGARYGLGGKSGNPSIYGTSKRLGGSFPNEVELCALAELRKLIREYRSK